MLLKKIIFCALFFIPVFSFAQDGQLFGKVSKLVPMKDGGVPQCKQVEENLPFGAIAHIRANNIQKLVFDFEKLVLKLLPEEALPPEMQGLLKDKHPLLSFVGMNMELPNMTIDMLGQITGLKFDAEASLSFYMAGSPEFILSLPVENIELMNNALISFLKMRSNKEIKFGKFTAYQLTCRNRDLPSNLYLTYSKDRAYLSNGTTYLKQLASKTNLLKDSVFSRSMEAYKDKDLLLSVSIESLKPMITQMASGYKTLPPQMVAQGRKKLIKEITSEMGSTDMLNSQIRYYSELKDFNELLDFTECYLLPTYEIMFKELYGKINDFEGLTVALDLDATYQKVIFAAYSKELEASRGSETLNMVKIREAFAALPKGCLLTHVTAKTKAATKSEACALWLTEVEKRLDKKKLSKINFTAIKNHITNSKPLASLESRVPWTLSTIVNQDNYFDVKDINSLGDYGTFIGELMSDPKHFSLKLIPAKEATFGDFLLDKKTSLESSLKADLTLEQTLFPDQKKSWLSKSVRLKHNQHQAGLKRWSLERIYTSNSGFFGYDQHELINRDIYYTGALGSYLAIEKTGSNTPWLSGSKTAGKPSKALLNMLEQLPMGTTDFSILDNRNAILSLAELLTSAENVAHKELKNYLKEVSAFTGTDSRSLSSIDMPLYVQSLNKSKKTGEYYLVLLGGDMSFPRPKALAVVNDILAPYAKKDSELGGSISYQVKGKGYLEAGLIQNTDALAWLIKSSVNGVFKKYVNVENGLMTLMMKVMGERDQNPDLMSEVVLVNPLTSN